MLQLRFRLLRAPDQSRHHSPCSRVASRSSSSASAASSNSGSRFHFLPAYFATTISSSISSSAAAATDCGSSPISMSPRSKSMSRLSAALRQSAPSETAQLRPGTDTGRVVDNSKSSEIDFCLPAVVPLNNWFSRSSSSPAFIFKRGTHSQPVPAIA